MNKLYFLLFLFILISCKDKKEKIKPTISAISESIYASGSIKSKDQYQAFSTVNGIISAVYVSEGDTIKKGTPLLSIFNNTQRLNKENAELTSIYADFNANQGKLNEARMFVELSKNKMKIDSALYFRQNNLWKEQIGTKVELEQRELAYENSKTAYFSSVLKYDDLKKQLQLSSSQSKNNLLISSQIENDFTLRSEIDGVVYSLLKSKGEIVGLQTPLAVIGNNNVFMLEMQVDEYDIFKIKDGAPVLVTMDSYRGKIFEAKVVKIYPYMNERSKTFLVEAVFTKGPKVLFPNINFEANIVIQTKEKAMLVPRNYVMNDSIVFKSNGDRVVVKTGLKDYQKIEILSGISAEDELIKPKE